MTGISPIYGEQTEAAARLARVFDVAGAAPSLN